MRGTEIQVSRCRGPLGRAGSYVGSPRKVRDVRGLLSQVSELDTGDAATPTSQFSSPWARYSCIGGDESVASGWRGLLA